MKTIDIDPKKTWRMYAYMFRIIPRIIRQLQLGIGGGARMLFLFVRAYVRELKFKSVLVREGKRRIFIPSTRESEELVGFFIRRLITSWKLEGERHLESAIAFRESGGKIIIMSNHTGGVDAPVADYILRQALTEEYPRVWVAGKRIWESIFLRLFSRCVDLLTMYGMKYVRSATGEEAASIRAHNTAMLRWMKKNPRHLFFAFPQGTWCNRGYLTEGEPMAMRLVWNLRDKSKSGEDVMVLPAFLSGPEKIVPPIDMQEAGDAEFYHFLDKLTPGHVSYRFGVPLRGSDLFVLSDEEGIDVVMRSIADLAPTEEAKGPYAKR